MLVFCTRSRLQVNALAKIHCFNWSLIPLPRSLKSSTLKSGLYWYIHPSIDWTSHFVEGSISEPILNMFFEIAWVLPQYENSITFHFKIVLAIYFLLFDFFFPLRVAASEEGTFRALGKSQTKGKSNKHWDFPTQNKHVHTYVCRVYVLVYTCTSKARKY